MEQATEQFRATYNKPLFRMHEFSDNEPYKNDGVPQGRFTFEQVWALFHMKYLYDHDPDMPGLAEQALGRARDDANDLEYEVGQIEEAEAQREDAEAQRQLDEFFTAYNTRFRTLYED